MAKDKNTGVPKTPQIELFTVKLGIGDRIQFDRICPVEGSRAELEMGEELTKRVKIFPKDFEKCGIKEVKDEQGRTLNLHWDDIKEKPFQFTKPEVLVLQRRIDALDKKGELNINLMPLIRKIDAVKVTPEKKEEK